MGLFPHQTRISLPSSNSATVVCFRLFSGDSMSSAYEDLIGKIAATGISEEEAEHAARRCLMSMAKNGGFGYAGGATFAYFLAMSTTPPGAAVAVAYSA